MLRTWLARLRSDGGETLAEIIVTIAILGTAGLAVIAGLQLTVKTSDIQRKQTTGGAYVRSFAEAIENAMSNGSLPYTKCAGVDAYNVGAVTSQITGLDSTKYTLVQDAAKNISATTGVAIPGACASGSDTGVQQVTLHVKSKDKSPSGNYNRADETLVIVLRKPCSPAVTC